MRYYKFMNVSVIIQYLLILSGISNLFLQPFLYFETNISASERRVYMLCALIMLGLGAIIGELRKLQNKK
jgi:hypothetical protein